MQSPEKSADECKHVKRRGRPTKLTEQVELRLLRELSDGKLMGEICAAGDMPHRVTVQNWMASSPDFRSKVQRAREIGTDALAEAALTIADETPPMPGEVAKARLRADMRMKLAAAWNQPTYGNRPNVQITNEAPQVSFALTADQMAKLADVVRAVMSEDAVDVTPRMLAPSRRG